MTALRTSLLLALLLTACGSASTTPKPAPTPTPQVIPDATPTPAATPGITALTSIDPPSARWGAALAFDPSSRDLLLYGGQSNPNALPHDDTWTWDGLRWHQLHPAHTPPPLAGARLVLDPLSGHLLLMGGAGQRDGNGFPLQAGVWSWSGSDWTRLGESPIQDDQSNAAADPQSNQILLDSAGDTGAGNVAPPATFQGGGYVWNGTTWAKAAAHLTGKTTVLGSHDAGIADDPISGRVIEFGGTQQVSLGDTLGWDGSSWHTLRVAPAPGAGADPPAGTAMAATDSTFGHIIMLAGGIEDGKTPTTWQWDGQLWNRLGGNEPPLLLSGALSDDPPSGGVVLFGGIDETSGAATNATYVWRGNGWETIPASTTSG